MPQLTLPLNIETAAAFRLSREAQGRLIAALVKISIAGWKVRQAPAMIFLDSQNFCFWTGHLMNEV
jgi:hypothetical protein